MSKTPLGDKPMSAKERKKRERDLKRDFGLVPKDIWVLPEDVDRAEKLHLRAVTAYEKATKK